MRASARSLALLCPLFCRPRGCPLLCAPDSPSISPTAGATRSRFGQHQGGRSLGKKKKIRHHVNPLKDVHMQPLDLPERWPEEGAFTQPDLPLHVDIGCARGLFCLDLAAESSGSANVLGLEIRSALAEAAAEDARRLGVANAAFLPCNANVNLEAVLLRASRCGPLQSVSIQFPDPWFKARHKKRRVVQPELVETIARHLEPGGWLFFQTDVLDLAQDARDTIRQAAAGTLRDAREDAGDWAAPKPKPLACVSTERERSCAELQRPVYRAVFEKLPAGMPAGHERR
ncbi:hypothetical protein EMIHUDRAFT_76396 [Emiliania huxleyi CCMP1516]|uniref:tRNA (guanine(46)-N(7))-methyltransferase n=2 Tax=Emiliania huxleyi TaxID=2903 RepID=A0A0D3ISP8_EMIH1|nr:hypothetical protein EMIHUDRAFT_76396 [Emiliania huxleyi CCMP1516]EOD14283.1 hypothetical protein EMIHUDRAFT_76396 [Emiliania huxleyi CCMP1516]|mmetsp:Transcript_30863/g.92050  ORF Transcript_30863/g.92050 Transcript_30863/m.92050 type:complete len:287 (+) Transcript_30863:64-924(+)|eukprot:XP_005766712.1 hypothetical protein EMIHUDRAFT_76396 [Emiliania huxleyi CCMP1516]